MKTLIIYVVFALWAGFGNAQEITELKAARIEFAPLNSEISIDGNSFSFVLMESFVGEFENDPISFMDKHFDFKQFKAAIKDEIKDKDYDSYLVRFKSSKGDLIANFNKEGKRLKAYFKLENVLLPADLREQLLRGHKGWVMVKNVHIAKEKNGLINKEYYRIKLENLENGSQRKNIKIDRAGAEQRLANN